MPSVTPTFNEWFQVVSGNGGAVTIYKTLASDVVYAIDRFKPGRSTGGTKMADSPGVGNLAIVPENTILWVKTSQEGQQIDYYQAEESAQQSIVDYQFAASGNVNWDLSNGIGGIKLDMSGNVTLGVTNTTEVDSVIGLTFPFIIYATQDGTGGRTLTLSADFLGHSPEISTAANQTSMIQGVYADEKFILISTTVFTDPALIGA